MPLPPPTATIRTQVSLPLRFADGYATAARVFSFDGLVDGLEHLAFGLGDRAAAVTAESPGRHRSSGRTANASPATRSAASAAIAGRSCAKPSSASPTPAATCCTCGRRGAASGSTPSSTPTHCRTRGWTPTRRTSRWATARTSAATRLPPRCWRCSRDLADRPAQQQPRQGPPAPPLRGDGCRAGADRRPPVGREQPLPGDQGPPRGAHARRPAGGRCHMIGATTSRRPGRRLGRSGARGPRTAVVTTWGAHPRPHGGLPRQTRLGCATARPPGRPSGALDSTLPRHQPSTG